MVQFAIGDVRRVWGKLYHHRSTFLFCFSSFPQRVIARSSLPSMISPSSYIFLIFLALLFLVHSSLSDLGTSEAALVCGNETALPSDRHSFTKNFISAMSPVNQLVLTRGFISQFVGSGSSTAIYVFAQCMNDFSLEDCELCLIQCHVQIVRCLPFQNSTRAGRLFSDGCYLRYDDHDFTNETLSIEDVTRCGPDEFKGNQSEFRATAVELLGNLSVEAPRSGGFHMGFRSRENLSVYGLAQCWEYENASECGRCLKSGVSNMETCLAKDEGRFLSVGCYLRFSTFKFYNNSDIYALGGSNLGRGGGHLVILLSSSFWMLF